MAGIGVPELLIVLAILLLIFGPKRLPTLGRQLGGGMREFKNSITGRGGDDDEDDEDDSSSASVAQQSGLPAAPPAQAPVAPAAPETVTAEPVADADPAAPPRQ